MSLVISRSSASLDIDRSFSAISKVTLTAATAIGSGYLWQFTTLTQKGNVVVARRRQRGNLIEFQGPDVATVVAKINAYESYISDNGVPASHL